jgi:hypothetical protein
MKNETQQRSETMNTYKNKNYTSRNYECTNIVCCEASEAPNANWVACDGSELDNLSQLYLENGIRYYGYL